MKITLKPLNFIISALFGIPGMYLIWVYAGWQVAIGVFLVCIASGVKVNE